MGISDGQGPRRVGLGAHVLSCIGPWAHSKEQTSLYLLKGAPSRSAAAGVQRAGGRATPAAEWKGAVTGIPPG